MPAPLASVGASFASGPKGGVIAPVRLSVDRYAPSPIQV
jgi:hypothetical protein